MPNYATHTAFGVVALSGISYIAVRTFSFPNEVIALSAMGFAFATVMLSPDLDLKYSSPTKNWKILRWMWRPYQLVFRHRGLSHSLCFSTITRMGYLTMIVVAGYMIATFGLAEFANLENTRWGMRDAVEFARDQAISHLPEVSAVGVGVLLSDWCHIAADRLVSALKILVRW